MPNEIFYSTLVYNLFMFALYGINHLFFLDHLDSKLPNTLCKIRYINLASKNTDNCVSKTPFRNLKDTSTLCWLTFTDSDRIMN